MCFWLVNRHHHVVCAVQVNSIGFSVTGLSMVQGGLTIKAKYQPSTPTKVDIAFQEATLVSGEELWGANVL